MTARSVIQFPIECGHALGKEILQRSNFTSICLLLLLSAFSGCGDAGSPGLSADPPTFAGLEIMNDIAKPESFCVGRFRFSGSDVFVSGRSQTLFGVDILTEPTNAQGADTIWANRTSTIRAATAPAGVNPVIREFELLPEVRALWHYTDGGRERLRGLFAMKNFSNHRLLASVETDHGKEPFSEQLFRNIFERYLADSPDGFCLGPGAVRTEPGRRESARISLRHRQITEFEFSLSTSAVAKKDPLDFDAEAKELAEITKQAGGSAKITRSVEREIAGMKGWEIRIELRSPTEAPQMLAQWFYGGTGDDPSRPRTLIKAVSPAAHGYRMLIAWDQILHSMQPIPLAPKQPLVP